MTVSEPRIQKFGKTNLAVPPIIFGASALGNLIQAISFPEKLDIMREWFCHSGPPVAVDTAGKHGAGLALEILGRGLKELGGNSDQIILSNKLGWKRTPLLRTAEPTFEPGAWKDIEHDAEQCISHDGILECWEQGCQLLGSEYQPELISVHDPDEYLAQAKTESEKKC